MKGLPADDDAKRLEYLRHSLKQLIRSNRRDGISTTLATLRVARDSIFSPALNSSHIEIVTHTLPNLQADRRISWEEAY